MQMRFSRISRAFNRSANQRASYRFQENRPIRKRESLSDTAAAADDDDDDDDDEDDVGDVGAGELSFAPFHFKGREVVAATFYQLLTLASMQCCIKTKKKANLGEIPLLPSLSINTAYSFDLMIFLKTE